MTRERQLGFDFVLTVFLTINHEVILKKDEVWYIYLFIYCLFIFCFNPNCNNTYEFPKGYLGSLSREGPSDILGFQPNNQKCETPGVL